MEFIIVAVVLIAAFLLDHRGMLTFKKEFSNKLIVKPGGYHLYLEEKSPYYSKLSEKGKHKFARRLKKFVDDKRFESKEGLELTEEMIVLISAAAIQLTFGLKKYLLSEFHEINIYPDAIWSGRRQEYHSGQTATSGFINISWKAFTEGMSDLTDKKNVGLHELAHALEFSYIFGNKYDNSFADFYESLEEEMRAEISRVRHEPGHFLRQYAGRNVSEFFAVSVENFFESPAALKEHLPAIYNNLCLVLNQDPLNPDDNLINPDSPAFQDVSRNVFSRSWHWSLTVLILGLFFSSGLLYYFTAETIVSSGHVFLILLSLTLVSGIVQYGFFRKKGWTGYIMFGLYNFLGIAMSAAALFFMLNFFILTGAEEQRIYSIEEVYSSSPAERKLDVLVYFPEIRSTRRMFASDLKDRGRYATHVLVTTRRGIFTFRVLGVAETD